MRIALDAMGGDFAPQINIDGAIAALRADPRLEIVLVGDRPEIERLLETQGYSDPRLTVHAADGVIGMAEKPTEAFRKKPNNSVAVCWRLMAGREVQAVVSAGNTGGMVAAGLWSRLFLKGVKRPGIAVALPTQNGRSLLMDVGANPDARPEHLYQYAVMGAIYSREILGVAVPRVGLMNIGEEAGKGTDLVRAAHQLISESRLNSQYIGNVEGRGLYQGDADVVICEGFVGNVVLKASEGVATMVMRTLAQELTVAFSDDHAGVKGVMSTLKKRFEYKEVGGAPLLGIDGICLICHGSSDGRSIQNALQAATSLEDHHVNARIVEELAERAAH